MKKLVLCSGGLDSVAALYYAVSNYEWVEMLFINWGQRNLRQERKAVRWHARHLGIKLIEVNAKGIFKQRLDDTIKDSLAPGYRALLESGDLDEQPKSSADMVTSYVPCRNSILLSIGASVAYRRGADTLFCGIRNSGKYYPDTTLEFLGEMTTALNRGSAMHLSIQAPFHKYSKEDELMRCLLELQMQEAELQHTVTCYAGKRKPCGVCSACLARKEAVEGVSKRLDKTLKI